MNYYLVYREPKGQPLTEPVGGLMVTGMSEQPSFSDVKMLLEVAHQRYHCDRTEQLHLEEAIDPSDQYLAWSMHARWEREMHEWLDWVNDTDCNPKKPR